MVFMFLPVIWGRRQNRFLSKLQDGRDHLFVVQICKSTRKY